jgi:hypothetical protein
MMDDFWGRTSPPLRKSSTKYSLSLVWKLKWRDNFKEGFQEEKDELFRTIFFGIKHFDYSDVYPLKKSFKYL